MNDSNCRANAPWHTRVTCYNRVMNSGTNPKVDYIELDKLKPLDGNPRRISADDMTKLRKSIKDNPDYFEARPIIVSDRTGELVIIGGNMRYRAAKLNGLKSAPTITVAESRIVHVRLNDGRYRKLTPIETERLQGFDDDWTKYGLYEDGVHEMSDSRRYQACGNAVTTKVVELVMRRIMEAMDD